MVSILAAASAFTLWWVDPYSDNVHLPEKAPADGIVTNALGCAAAKGEFETISFSVQPSRDLAKVDFVPSDLTGPGGAKIPASAADFALVKVWYRAGGRWTTSWAGNPGKPELINDLVLHDDALVKVDEKEQTILLRIDAEDGPVWVDMKKDGGDRFDASLHPVRDAKRFVPFDLKKGRFQQYWFTWHVPEDARPGLYRGTLDVTEAGRPLEKIPVEIEVYPFALPDSRTHYDTSRPYVCIWMGVPNLESELKGSKRMDVAEAKVRAIYRSLAEHNMHEQAPGTFKADSTEDLAVRSLILMRQEGMTHRILINGAATDFMWAANPEAPFVPPEQDPKRYDGVLGNMNRMADVQAAVLDRYVGHRRCYFSGADECGTYLHRRSYGFYAALHRHGFDIWSDSGVAADVGWCIGMNDIAASARHREAWDWHRSSARAVTYAGPFSGPASPDIWRRTKGLRYYYADFDGIDEYVFYYGGFNHWNDFRAFMEYCQFQIAYLTYDGLIRTLAYEGLREGLDDVRYLSLLKLRAQAAMKSSDPKTRALGRRHYVWMESRDPEAIIDLHAFRREVARRAAELVAVVGEEPQAKALRPVPELPPLRYGTEVPAGADLLKVALGYAADNRYDLALPLLGKVHSDKAQPVERRFAAVTREADLRSELLDRAGALALVEKALAWRELSKAQRGKLYLQRARLVMTPAVYAEHFTREQLDASAKASVDALQFSGATAKERFAAILKVVDAYLSSGYHQTAVDYAEARIADTSLAPSDHCTLLVREANAFVALKDWDKAAERFRKAHLTSGCDTREVLKTEGWVAEQRQDWETAQKCYQKEVRTYADDEANKRAWCEARIRRVTQKLSATDRKKGIDTDEVMNGSVDIDLDE